MCGARSVECVDPEGTPLVNGVDHVVLKFYPDVLGLTRCPREPCHFVWRKAGDLTVRNMDALAARLKEHHIPWLREPKDEGWDIEAFVTDPDGYQWAIVAPSHHGRWWVWPLNRLAAF